MKSFLRLVPVIFIIFFFYSNALGASAPKIGIVDIQKFQKISKAFQKTSARIQKKFDAMKKTLEEERKALQQLEEDFKKQSMMLSLDAHEDKKREVDRKKRYVKYLIDDFSQEMKETDRDNTKQILKELEKIIQKVGKDGGYTLILEKNTIGLIYADDATDVTDRVVQLYDSLRP
jgi:outer membrane protein